MGSSQNIERYDLAFKIAKDEVKDLKYFYGADLPELISAIAMKLNYIDQNVIDAAKDALTEHFFDGCDIEWNEDQCKEMILWDSISPEWFGTSKFNSHSFNFDVKHLSLLK